MNDIEKYIEGKLKDRDFFDYVMPKAVAYLRMKDIRYKCRLYELMSMRLGHTTGKKMRYKEVAKHTISLTNNSPVTSTYCSQMYKRGLRLARKVITKLGHTIKPESN